MAKVQGYRAPWWWVSLVLVNGFRPTNSDIVCIKDNFLRVDVGVGGVALEEHIDHGEGRDWRSRCSDRTERGDRQDPNCYFETLNRF